MALSHLAIEKAKPKEKPYMLSDGDGLHVLVHPPLAATTNGADLAGAIAETAIE